MDSVKMIDRAYASDRSIERHNKYYIATIIEVSHQCIALAYYTWLSYKTGYKTFYDDKYFRSCLEHADIIKISDIKVPYKIFTSLDNITSKDTYDFICLFYSKEHVSLIMHEDYLSKTNLSFLRYHSKPNFNSIIRSVEPKISINSIINTLDLECIRSYNKDKDIIEHKPYCLSYVINNKAGYTLGYTAIEDFFYMLDNSYKDKIYNNNKPFIQFWIHYGSKYDNHIIIDKIGKLVDKTVDQPIILLDTNQSLIQLDINLRYCRIRINDSYRLLSSSLKSLGDAFKVATPKQDIDPTKFTEESFNNPKVIEYAIADAKCLQQVLFKFQTLCTSNNLKLSNPLNFCTLTSMAKNTFYSFFYDTKNYLMELNKPAHDYIRQSYKGGTVKCCKPGIYGPTASYDIKSSYPSAGCNPIPCKSLKFDTTRRWINTQSDLPTDLSYIRCQIYKPSTPEHTSIGIHDIYDIKDDGEIRTLFSVEISRGLDLGYRYYMLDRIGFDGKETILKDFFTYVFDLKQKANKDDNPVLELIFKLIINAAYGYFGFDRFDKDVLRIYNITDDNIKHCAAVEELEEGTYTIRNDLIYAIQSINIMTKATNIAVAAAITSYARIKLYDLAKTVEDMGYDVYYCDTDSIKTNMLEPPINNNMFGSNLGQAALEYKDYDCLETCFYQKKILTGIYRHKTDSSIKYVIKFKGININKIYINNIDIEKTDDTYKKNLIAHMKSCYLNKIPVTIDHGQIKASRQDIVNSKPFLYETVCIKINTI